LKLKDKLNAVHLGQTTFGVIAYGINYSYTYNTPSGKFTIMPTDMNYHKYISYEGYGITPDIPLNFDEDWIEQTMRIIENDTQK
jgi:C-terminal processing protease CtpA/Prc